ncbi:MAG: hypothetical protein QMD36_01950 [Candidatus Aenigmarchaeota archaeon]|nr:hypothetical protein [Candidatus Aenigmarchaeota archaeon]
MKEEVDESTKFEDQLVKEVELILSRTFENIEKKMDEIGNKFGFDLAYRGRKIDLNFELRDSCRRIEQVRIFKDENPLGGEESK